MTPKNHEKIYHLEEGVRIFSSGPEEFRFRKGVWNFTEAVVKLQGQDEKIKAFFASVMAELGSPAGADARKIADAVGASPEERQGYEEILADMKTQGYLYDTADQEARRIISGILGGRISGFEEYTHQARPMLFVTDNDYAREAARTMARQTQLPLDILDRKSLDEIRQADLATRTEALEYLKPLEKLQEGFRSPAGILASLISPDISLLRNLNRIAIALEKPFILGFTEGPFLTVLSTLATQTGCFECFEQRMLARLEDTVVYHQFVKSLREGQTRTAPAGATIFSPAAHLLTAAVMAEGFVYATLDMLRLAGRIVSVYLPLLEIQVQDLLRVPYCPACGFIAQAQMDEMYTSSRRIVDQMLKKIDITEPKGATP